MDGSTQDDDPYALIGMSAESLGALTTVAGEDHGSLSGLGDDDHLQYLLLAGRPGSANDFTISTTTNAIMTATVVADATLSIRCGTATDPGPILLFDHLTSLAGADIESLLVALSQASLPFTNAGKSVTILEVGSIGFGTRGAWQMNQNMTSGFGAGGRVFAFRPRIQQESGETRTDGGAWATFLHLPEFHALNANLTIPISRALTSAVETSRTGTPVGTLTEDTAVYMEPTYDTGWTATTRRGVWMRNRVGAGTQATVVGLDMDAQTGVAVLACSVRSADASTQLRHAGPGVFGANAGPSNASVALEVQSTTQAFVVPRMTTTQRDALTAINGMIVYNTTTNTFQGRANAVWANL